MTNQELRYFTAGNAVFDNNRLDSFGYASKICDARPEYVKEICDALNKLHHGIFSKEWKKESSYD